MACGWMTKWKRLKEKEKQETAVRKYGVNIQINNGTWKNMLKYN